VRVGREGESFVCLKFRTMCVDAPAACPCAGLRHPERYVTRAGRFLRRTGFDELPQLWNVLRGEMSLVGPRPLIPTEGEIHRLRRAYGVLSQRPGITGLAQIYGRTALSDRQKLQWELVYLERSSVFLDMWILLLTILPESHRPYPFRKRTLKSSLR
jgi:O-antigen biosynthesis protein WbqP